MQCCYCVHAQRHHLVVHVEPIDLALSMTNCAAGDYDEGEGEYADDEEQGQEGPGSQRWQQQQTWEQQQMQQRAAQQQQQRQQQQQQLPAAAPAKKGGGLFGMFK